MLGVTNAVPVSVTAINRIKPLLKAEFENAEIIDEILKHAVKLKDTGI